MSNSSSDSGIKLLRLRQVLALIPVSKSHWWAGVAAGIFPHGLKLNGCTVWRFSDISALSLSLK
jgi:predicted DNA-binding transcriptional regulator AlpA